LTINLYFTHRHAKRRTNNASLRYGLIASTILEVGGVFEYKMGL